jgi:hypothetical protein
MALDLSLSYVQSNDNKTLIVTDTTSTGTGGWGDGTNINVTDIDGSTHTLELQVKIKTSDGTETTYDYIDLHSEFGSFSGAEDLVFSITAPLLISLGSPLGTSATKLPDGIYTISYYVDRGLAGDTSITDIILIDGQVRVEVYDLLRKVPVKYNCSENYRDCFPDEYTLDTLGRYSYLKGMEFSATLSKQEEILAMLSNLQELIED